MSEAIDISGIDKAELLAALYNNSRPMGMGFLRAKEGEMTVEQARAEIGNGDDHQRDFGQQIYRGSLYFDYLHGRPLKSEIGGDTFNRILKDAFHRPRPELFMLETPYARPVSASFPSGHATASMVLYLVLAYLLVRLGGKGVFRYVVLTIAGLLIVLIGVSRMYLGVHYPSDVLAGYVFGFCWAVFCAFIIEAVRGLRRGRRRRAQEVQPVSEAPAPPPNPGQTTAGQPAAS